MGNELTVIEQKDEQQGAFLMQQATPEQWANRRQQFNQWVNTQLHKGVDYGEIPGVDKPALLKPGAEKIMQLFGCVADARVIHREQNMETGHLYVEVMVDVVDLKSGRKVGAGIGSCSTMESKYRWRKEWYNGQGNPTGDEWERTRSGKWFRKVANQDLFDQWNTVVKMAKKRALVDAALSISGASEKFTQDVEDNEVQDEPAAAPNPQKPAAVAGDWVNNARYVKAFHKFLDELGLTNEQALEALGVDALGDYKGSTTDAKAAVNAYTAAQIARTEQEG